MVNLWHIIMGFWTPSWPLVIVPFKLLCFSGWGWQRRTTRMSVFTGRGTGICWWRGWGWWLWKGLATTCRFLILLWSWWRWQWRVQEVTWWAWLWSCLWSAVWAVIVSRGIEDVFDIGKVISKLAQTFTWLRLICVAKGAKRFCLQREHMSCIERFMQLVAYRGGKVALFRRAIRFFALVFIIIIIIWGGCPSMLISLLTQYEREPLYFYISNVSHWCGLIATHCTDAVPPAAYMSLHDRLLTLCVQVTLFAQYHFNARQSFRNLGHFQQFRRHLIMPATIHTQRRLQNLVKPALPL